VRGGKSVGGVAKGERLGGESSMHGKQTSGFLVLRRKKKSCDMKKGSRKKGGRYLQLKKDAGKKVPGG